jgi:arsenate reductase
MVSGPYKVLFLCTGNACRSQMAEGWTRALLGSSIEAYSAGVAPQTLDPRAVAAMNEAGVDISSHRAKHVDDLDGIDFDCVVTVCGRAQRNCPAFPGLARRIHAGFDDPPELARDAETESEALEPYRRVRDEIREFVQGLPGDLHPTLSKRSRPES